MNSQSEKWREVEMVHAYVDGRLSEPDRRAMERHLELDDETRDVVDAYLRQTRLLRELFGKPDTAMGGQSGAKVRNDH